MSMIDATYAIVVNTFKEAVRDRIFTVFFLLRRRDSRAARATTS